MDEKLNKELRRVINFDKYTTEERIVEIEQAFRDAGWIEPQQSAGGESALADRLEAIRITCGKQCLDIEEDIAYFMDELDRVRGITHHLSYWCKKCKKKHVDSHNLFKSHKKESAKDSVGIIRKRGDTILPISYPTHFIGGQQFPSLYDYSEFMQKSGAEHYGKNLYENPVEPQQSEGEVVNACKGCSVEGIQTGCSEEDKNKCDRWDLAKAQLAHDKERMLPIPTPVNYNCPKDCHFLYEEGCWVEDIFPANSSFELDDPKLSRCPYYTEPMVKLPSEGEVVKHFCSREGCEWKVGDCSGDTCDHMVAIHDVFAWLKEQKL